MAGSVNHLTATENGQCSIAAGSLHPLRCHSLNRDVSESKFIVVMGVSGTGKSTLGAALARTLHLPFIDGDNLHPCSNVAKMARGEPLDDADRQSWLETIRKTAINRVLERQLCVDHGERVEQPTSDETGPNMIGRERRQPSPVRDDDERGRGVIIACSSLKKRYRAVLRGESATHTDASHLTDTLSLPTYFVYLEGDRDVLMARMQNRKGHFMKASMLESQLNTLENPEGEPGVVTVSVEMSTEEQVQRALDMFRSQGP